MRPATSISPDVGRSRPAIERRVVVLPQPDGPSTVNSFPSGTSNATFCAALTAAPRSLAYSVNSDLTLSTFVSSESLLVLLPTTQTQFRHPEVLAFFGEPRRATAPMSPSTSKPHHRGRSSFDGRVSTR